MSIPSQLLQIESVSSEIGEAKWALAPYRRSYPRSTRRSRIQRLRSISYNHNTKPTCPFVDVPCAIYGFTFAVEIYSASSIVSGGHNLQPSKPTRPNSDHQRHVFWIGSIPTVIVVCDEPQIWGTWLVTIENTKESTGPITHNYWADRGPGPNLW